MQPTMFDQRQVGEGTRFTVPPALLAIADEVIE
jgi:hypothetical protein